MAFAVSQQSSRAQNTESQKTTSQNKKVTTITKIDTKSQSITIRESSPSQRQTETFKYDTETRFVISGTGNYTGSAGTIKDMKVGDSVVIMRDNADLITSIQKINVFHNQQ